MVHIRQYCRFHPVGQGLFYSGRINISGDGIASRTWDYVYDCGSEKRNAILIDSIERFVNDMGGNRLSLLVLSHLHWDHVSGLKRLLQLLKGRIGRVILPYYFPSERAVIYGLVSESEGFLTSEDTDWYSEFMQDPVPFIFEYGDIDEIIFIRGGDGPGTGEEPPTGQEDHDTILEDDRQSGVATLVVRSELDILGRGQQAGSISLLEKAEKEAGCKLHTKKVQYLNSFSCFEMGYWLISFFNKEVPIDKIKDLNNAFVNLKASKSLVEVLRDDKILRYLKAMYQTTFEQRDLNDTSLSISCSLGLDKVLANRAYVAQRTDRSPWRSRFVNHICNRMHAKPNIVLTGDLPALKVWGTITRKFRIGPPSLNGTNVLIYQLPHHGSGTNWDPRQIGIPYNPIYVITAGSDNRYKHPSGEVLRALTIKGKILYLCNEHEVYGQIAIRIPKEQLPDGICRWKCDSYGSYLTMYKNE